MSCQIFWYSNETSFGLFHQSYLDEKLGVLFIVYIYITLYTVVLLGTLNLAINQASTLIVKSSLPLMHLSHSHFLLICSKAYQR